MNTIELTIILLLLALVFAEKIRLPKIYFSVTIIFLIVNNLILFLAFTKNDNTQMISKFILGNALNLMGYFLIITSFIVKIVYLLIIFFLIN